MNNNSEWRLAGTDVFWAEIAPCEHVVQIYENDEAFTDALAGFVTGGVKAGECSMVIATDAHLLALTKRLHDLGLDVGALISEDLYLSLNAHEVLSKFMVNNWPEEVRFINVVSGLIERATGRNRKVRAFGEMVAVLWAQGSYGATVHLEHLWNKFCEKQSLSLFCAYPKSGFTKDINESIAGICGCHSRMIDGASTSLHEVLYRDVV